jgi:hypothetical protein
VNRRGRVAIWTFIVALLVGGLGVVLGVGRPALPSPLGQGTTTNSAGATVAAPRPRPTIPAPTISIQPVPARQDGTISVAGAGFRPDEPVALAVTGLPASKAAIGGVVTLGQARADQHGAFRLAKLTLPDDVISGPHPLRATGQISQQVATGRLLVRAKSTWVTVGTYSLKPGADLGFVAGGFRPAQTIDVSMVPARLLPNGGSQDPTQLSPGQSLTTVKADAVGNTTWIQVPVPLLKPGTYDLTLAGASGSPKVLAAIVVQPFTPVAQLSPWSGPPGSQLQLNLRGFAPNEPVQVFLGPNSPAVLTATADHYGNLWGAGPIQVPYQSNGGSLDVVCRGERSGATVSAPFKVLATRPWLQLSEWSGPPGAPVQFTGGGWAANETVTVHLNNASGPVVAAGETNGAGYLQEGAETGVPGDATPGGAATTTTTFVAVGSRSNASASASFQVVNPYAGVPTNPPNLP